MNRTGFSPTASSSRTRNRSRRGLRPYAPERRNRPRIWNVSKYDDDLLQRVARLYRIPGVSATKVCERLGVTRYAIAKATKRFGGRRPSPEDLVLAALTREGANTRGPWPTADKLTLMASWVDYVNKDGSTAENIEAMLDGFVRAGVLRRDGNAFVLLKPFP